MASEICYTIAEKIYAKLDKVCPRTIKVGRAVYIGVPNASRHDFSSIFILIEVDDSIRFASDWLDECVYIPLSDPNCIQLIEDLVAKATAARDRWIADNE